VTAADWPGDAGPVCGAAADDVAALDEGWAVARCAGAAGAGTLAGPAEGAGGWAGTDELDGAALRWTGPDVSAAAAEAIRRRTASVFIRVRSAELKTPPDAATSSCRRTRTTWPWRRPSIPPGV
jgi:hypothetical protein